MVAPSVVVFFVVFMMSFFLVVGFDDWFVVWMGLEMNMVSFISMVWARKEGMGVESLYKYFFVQSLASGVFLVMMCIGGYVSLALMMKLAVGPFYFWLPSVMVGLSWMMNLVLVTVQKLLPLVLLKGVGGYEIWVVGMLSLIIGVVGSFNQSNLKVLMAYSSVNHTGWILIALMLGGVVWLVYFLVYVIVVIPVFMIISSSNMIMLVGHGLRNGVVFLLMILNMAGMPPMAGFVMSWVVLWMVLEMDIVLSLMMVMSSLVMFYIYVRIVYEEVMGGGLEVSWVGDLMWYWTGMVVFFFVGSFMFPVLLVFVKW